MEVVGYINAEAFSMHKSITDWGMYWLSKAAAAVKDGKQLVVYLENGDPDRYSEFLMPAE